MLLNKKESDKNKALLEEISGQIEKETKKISLGKIREAGNGKFAIQRHDEAQNAIIWYI